MNRLMNFSLVTALLLLQACVSNPPLGGRHQASGLNTRFNGGQLSFVDYVAQSRSMIAKTHQAANPDELAKIVEGNAPFELKPEASCAPGQGKPYRRGVLLTHGLTDSPYFMRSLAKFFQKNCFRVMAVLLPGHGTRPGDLLDVSWQEWAMAEAYGTDRLATEVDEVYLAGFSTGGALSIYQSQNDKRVRGLFLFSPALKVTSLAALANVHKMYSWAAPSTKWLNLMPDKDFYKYESFPANAAAQIYALTKAVEAQSQTISIPVFAAASQDDTTVDTQATIDFMGKMHNPASRLVLYSTDPGRKPDGIAPGQLEMVNSVFPGQKILSSAHTAIMLPPEDAHYGAAGDYSNCLHYYPNEKQKYDACSNHRTADFQGELTKANLAAGTLRRLMYNPNYTALEISLEKFIADLP